MDASSGKTSHCSSFQAIASDSQWQDHNDDDDDNNDDNNNDDDDGASSGESGGRSIDDDLTRGYLAEDESCLKGRRKQRKSLSGRKSNLHNDRFGDEDDDRLGENDQFVNNDKSNKTNKASTTKGFSEVALSLERLTKGIGDMDNDRLSGNGRQQLADNQLLVDKQYQDEDASDQSLLFAIGEMAKKLSHLSEKSLDKIKEESKNSNLNLNKKLTEILRNLHESVSYFQEMDAD